MESNEDILLSSEEEKEDLLIRKEKFEKNFEKIKEMWEETSAVVDKQGLFSCIDICNKKDKKLLKFLGLVNTKSSNKR